MGKRARKGAKMTDDPGPTIMFDVVRLMERFGLIDIRGWSRTEPLGVVGIDGVVYRYCARYCVRYGVDDE